MPATADGHPNADKLQERLNDPKVAEGLNRLLDQLDTLSFTLESVDGFLQRGDVIADSISDGVADFRRTQGDSAEFLESAPRLLKAGGKLANAASEMDVDELQRSHVLTRLTERETLESLNRLLDRLPLFEFLVGSLEGFLGRGEAVADNIAAALRELKLDEKEAALQALLPLLESAPRLAEAAERLSDSELLGDGLPKVIGAGVTMIESGMLDEQVVSTLGELGRKGAETYEEVASQPVKPVGGLFSLIRATSDPDVQKSLGFFFAFAKAFSKHVK